MISKERYDVLGKKYVISLLKEISAGKIFPWTKQLSKKKL